MLTIKTAETGKLRLAELIEFGNTVLDLFRRIDPKQKLLVNRIKSLVAALTPLDKGFTENAGETLQAEMRPQDSQRMATIRGLKKSIQAESFREETKIQQQSAMMLKSLSHYATNLSRLSLPHKTILIRKMLEEWSTNTDYAAAINDLGLTRWVTDLTSKNNLFYEDQLEKARKTAPTEKTQNLKKALVKVYRELVKDVESVARVDDEDTSIVALIHELNGIIDMYNVPVSNRVGRKKKEVVEESPPAPMPMEDFEQVVSF